MAMVQSTSSSTIGAMAEDLHELVAGLSDQQFEQLYGPLAHLRPSQAAGLLDGLAAPWWIVGGWAIEAFTGHHRDHEDLDVCVLACDVPLLLEHFIGTHHVWAIGAGMLCPVLTVGQRLPTWLNQIWVRETATEPWLLDVIVTPDLDGRWVFERDPTYVDDLESVTWHADDGIVYQKPEITLSFKAAHARSKDTADLEVALPKLTPAAKAWLAETITRLHPGHSWLRRF